MNPESRPHARLDLAFIASLAAIAAVTFVPSHGGYVNLQPFDDIVAAFTPPLVPSLLLGVTGNVIIFAPLGAVLWRRGLPLTKAVLVGVGFSVGIEVTQLIVPGRTTSFDDVLLNTLGVALGHSIAAGWTGSRPEPES